MAKKKYVGEIEDVGQALKIAEEHNLVAEVWLYSLKAMKESPGISIKEALKDGLNQWDL